MMCSLYWMQMGLLASVSYHIREGKAPSTRFFFRQDVLTTGNLFAKPACQFTQVVQHCTMRRTAAEAVSNQQATQRRSNSGPHYMNRPFSTVCRRPVHHHQLCSQSCASHVASYVFTRSHIVWHVPLRFHRSSQNSHGKTSLFALRQQSQLCPQCP